MLQRDACYPYYLLANYPFPNGIVLEINAETENMGGVVRNKPLTVNISILLSA